MTVPNLKCPKCKHKKLIKFGGRMVGGKRVQRYECQNCGFHPYNPIKC